MNPRRHRSRTVSTKSKNGIIAVYDLGGGTFDISILKLHDGIFEVIATNGDTHLGGDDIDNLLITIALDDISGDLGVDLRRNAEAVQAIRKAVIEAKIALSSEPSVEARYRTPGTTNAISEKLRANSSNSWSSRSSIAPWARANRLSRTRISSQNRLMKSCWSVDRPAFPEFARLSKRPVPPRTAHRTESRRSCRTRSSGASQHPWRRLRSYARHAPARRHSPFARNRSCWRSDRQDHSSQFDDPSIGDAVLHHPGRWPGERRDPCLAGRTRTGQGLPLAGPLRS